MGTRKIRSDKGGHHNYPKRNKNVAADIKISNKQILLDLAKDQLRITQEKNSIKLEMLKQQIEKLHVTELKDMYNKDYADLLEVNNMETTKLKKFIEDISNKRRITNKALELYETMLSRNKDLDREEQFGKLMLNRLMHSDIDISDTTGVKKLMGGYTPFQLYNAFIDMGNKSDDWYDAITNDLETTLEDIINFLNKNKEAQ